MASKQQNLDRLSSLSAENLAALVQVVEDATMLGVGYLVREAGGSFVAKDPTEVVIRSWEA